MLVEIRQLGQNFFLHLIIFIFNLLHYFIMILTINSSLNNNNPDKHLYLALNHFDYK